MLQIIISILLALGLTIAQSDTNNEVQQESGGPQVVNSDFNSWFQDGRVWYPDLNLTPEYYFWDSGNKGADSFGTHNLTVPETEFVVSGKAAKLMSKSIFGIFAAGSIYTGKFLKRQGMGANISMGVPFQGKPTGFKGYYCYKPGTIDKTDDAHTYLSGVTDTCNIYAILTEWDEPFIANTHQGKFVDLNTNLGILAIAQVSSGETNNGYVEFNIPFSYRSLSVNPTYILIVAAASKYGNYFTGSTESVLYVDQFSLTYD